MQHRHEQIEVERLTAIDLRQEAADAGVEAEAYRITLCDDDGQQPKAEEAEAVWIPSEGRLGIAWGADATWASVRGVEAGIEMWCNDPDEWESRN